MTRYSKINVGDTATITHTIASDDIKNFVDLSGDDNRLHIDNEFASKISFKKPVAHGMIGASFISTIIGTKIPGDGVLRAPLRRLTEPQDVADAISYLISEKSDFLTGETVRVNGGQVMI
jgi:acyl dehydratase